MSDIKSTSNGDGKDISSKPIDDKNKKNEIEIPKEENLKKDKEKEKNRDKSRDKNKKKKKDSKKKKRKQSKEKSRSRSKSIKKRSKKSRSRSKSKSRKRKISITPDRKRRKSRTVSKSKSISKRSRSRSKSDPKKKKNYRFDSPPKDKPFFQPLPFDTISSGVGLVNPISAPLPKMQVNNFNPIPTNGSMMGPPDQNPAELLQKIQMLNTLQNIQASKSDRKLYIGNLPTNLTPQTLCDVLNSALQKMGINSNPGNSIVSAWISNDGHYAFVEFRTPEEANNGFALNNVALFGQHLKVGRPRTYAATQAIQQGPLIMPGLNNLPTLNPMNPLGAPLAPGMFGSQSTIKVQPPTKVLVLKNMIQIHELEIDEEFSEILQDVKEECSKYGNVVSIKIPRPKGNENVVGLGKIFVEFSNIEQSKEARKNLAGRTFSNNTVECSYHDEKMYFENNLME